jgi:hypothetical protein
MMLLEMRMGDGAVIETFERRSVKWALATEMWLVVEWPMITIWERENGVVEPLHERVWFVRETGPSPMSQTSVIRFDSQFRRFPDSKFVLERSWISEGVSMFGQGVPDSSDWIQLNRSRRRVHEFQEWAQWF